MFLSDTYADFVDMAIFSSFWAEYCENILPDYVAPLLNMEVS